MPNLVAQLGSRKWVLLTRRQSVEELDHLRLVLKKAVVFGAEELSQVKRVVNVLLVLVDGDALGEAVGNHARQLVREQVERRKRSVRIVLRVVGPLRAGGLLVRVTPVEHLLFAEPSGGESLERRTG